LLSNPGARQFLADQNRTFALTRRHEASAAQLANLYRYVLGDKSKFEAGQPMTDAGHAS
jgi:hypothetical protein